MDAVAAARRIDEVWTESIEPSLAAYIRVPNRSPLFDPDWEAHGHMDRAAAILLEWCRSQPLAGLHAEIIRLPGRTPVIYAEVEGTAPGQVLLYGHFDKQPEFTGWSAGLDPWTPVLRDGRLYGRGGADDGYALYASLLAIRTLQEQGLPHARCSILIEGSEESGSTDLPAYVAHLQARLGTPELVICLDAECGNYDQFWLTTSLRGNLVGTLAVEVLTEGVHSGMATGIAPSALRITRGLLDRIENVHTGDVTLEPLHVKTPPARLAEARAAARVLGASVAGKLPFAPGVRPLSNDPTELLINSTWKPTLAVTGADGLPPLASAGNTLLPRLALQLSLRLPPTLEGAKAAEIVQKLLRANPPHGAEIALERLEASTGWNAPKLAPWLEASLARASQAAFGRPPAYMGEGGSIPFMAMLGQRFPQAQFVVTGVLGPHSNAHGPNEFLHVPYAKKLTAAVAHVIAQFP